MGAGDVVEQAESANAANPAPKICTGALIEVLADKNLNPNLLGMRPLSSYIVSMTDKPATEAPPANRELPSFSHPISEGRASQSTKHSLGQKLEPGLYVIATPIGNLRDISLRALDVLGAADIILAEDTRQTKKLLSAYEITTPLSAYHDHNAAKRIPALLARLAAGEVIALVSDAGTPLVSDPGFKLTRDAAAAGHKVVPLPGASAVLAALVTAGLPSDIFTFAGFLPAKSAARKAALEGLSAAPGTLILFESPARVLASLKDMKAVLGERPAALARELTKHYEETRRGTLSELIISAAEDPPRGEIVVVIGAAEQGTRWSAEQVEGALAAAVPEQGVGRASAEIAAMSGWKKRDVYQRALSLKTDQADGAEAANLPKDR